MGTYSVTSFSPNSLSEGQAAMQAQVERRSDSDPTSVLTLNSQDDPQNQIDGITDQITVVRSDMVLWSWPDSHITQLAKSLGPDRWLVFLEPVVDLGWREFISTRLTDRDTANFGHSFTRDVPQDFRRAGLQVTTVVRFDIGRRLTYAWGEARQVR